jgi:hypothetical protein
MNVQRKNWPVAVLAKATSSIATSSATPAYSRVGLAGEAFAVLGRFFGGVELSPDGVVWLPCSPGFSAQSPRAGGRGSRILYLRRSPDSNPGGTVVLASFDSLEDAERAARDLVGDPAADAQRAAPSRTVITSVTKDATGYSQQSHNLTAGAREVLCVNDVASAGDLWVADTAARAVVGSATAIRIVPGGSATITPRGSTLGYATTAAAVTMYFAEDLYE